MFFIDEKMTTSSTDLSLIMPNVYLGSIEAACNTDYLKKLGITHILTVEDNQLCNKFIEEFKYKFVRVFDSPDFEVLTILNECFQFIDEGSREQSAILIHCLLGVSRSATILIAYIMHKHKKSLDETLEFMKDKRFVRPNPGFLNQLKLLDVMRVDILNKQSTAYKAYMLERLAEQVQNGGDVLDLVNEFGTIKQQQQQQQQSTTNYKCKKCRFNLFDKENLVKHLKAHDYKAGNDWNSKINYYKKLIHNTAGENSNEKHDECDNELYIEPVSWMLSSISELEGKINCPNCQTKLGSYSWCGQKCSCATWIVPAFHIPKSKVDAPSTGSSLLQLQQQQQRMRQPIIINNSNNGNATSDSKDN